MAVEWRARRWRRLIDIIDQLPRDSRYVEAVSLDEGIAEEILNVEQRRGEAEAGRAARRMSEWSATVELLTLILNRLGEVAQAIAVLGGAKPRKLKPAPMPVTMVEKLRKRRRYQAHRALVARVLPPRTPPSE